MQLASFSSYNKDPNSLWSLLILIDLSALTLEDLYLFCIVNRDKWYRKTYLVLKITTTLKGKTFSPCLIKKRQYIITVFAL